MKRLVLTLCIAGMFSAASWAENILDFSTPAAASGSVSYGGGTMALVGTNIESDTITGILTPANAGGANKLTCTGCVVDFTTGADTGVWTWGANNSMTAIEVIGEVTSLGITSPTVLLSGDITGASITTTGGLSAAIIGFLNVVNPTLAAYFGDGSAPSWQGNFNLDVSFPNGQVTGAAFTADSIGSGDLQTTPTPEPASVMLLGTAILLGAAAIRRRKSGKV